MPHKAGCTAAGQSWPYFCPQKLQTPHQLVPWTQQHVVWVSLPSPFAAADCPPAAGPHIDWSPGRSDKIDGAACPEDGRLPDASKGAPHIRDVFNRMGFNDREIVALSGGMQSCIQLFAHSARLEVCLSKEFLLLAFRLY